VKLDHVALAVHDIEAGIALMATLGMTLTRRGKHYASGLPIAFVTNPATGVHVELIESPGTPAPTFLHLAFVVDDIQETCAQLQKDGYVFEREPFFNEANRSHMAFLRHPDGLIAQINQPEK
jgi:catechol 2,3-dioxygenase-like lactoylglutathione lyase family enzyme